MTCAVPVGRIVCGLIGNKLLSAAKWTAKKAGARAKQGLVNSLGRAKTVAKVAQRLGKVVLFGAGWGAKQLGKGVARSAAYVGKKVCLSVALWPC